MKKRILLNVLVICMIFAALVPAAAASEVTQTTEAVRAGDECGEGITWTYADGVLTISGDGEMDDFENGVPWVRYQDEITTVTIEGALTYIGAKAFRDHDALKTVDFGDALYEIGREAFASCDALVSIKLPATFKIFGESSFSDCKSLKEIHCAGGFPTFKMNSMWRNYVTIYYPAERPWKAETIQEVAEGHSFRLTFLAEDSTEQEEPAEPETEPATEPVETEPPVTEPETVPPTEATVPATEAPVTQPVTEPVVTEPQTEPEPTEEATGVPAPTEPKEEDLLDSIPAGLLIVGGVLTLLVLGALLFGGKFGKKGRFSK